MNKILTFESGMKAERRRRTISRDPEPTDRPSWCPTGSWPGLITKPVFTLSPTAAGDAEGAPLRTRWRSKCHPNEKVARSNPIRVTNCGSGKWSSEAGVEGELRSFPFRIQIKNATVMQASAAQPEQRVSHQPLPFKEAAAGAIRVATT